MVIKRINRDKEIEDASKLIWQVFYRFEGRNYTLEGLESFCKFIEPLNLKLNTYDGYIRLFGAYEGKNLLGVGGLRQNNHICLLFVREDMHGKGIGKMLLKHLVAQGEEDITVNSSDYAVGFYKHHDFEETGPREIKDGIIFTPMLYKE